MRGKLLHAKLSQVYLLTLKLLAGKERKKSRKRRIIGSTVIFNRFQKVFNDNLLHNSQLLIIR